MLAQGSYQEKMKLAFKFFDTNAKGHLTTFELDSFLKALVFFTICRRPNEFDIAFNQNLHRFWKKMSQIIEKKNSIKFEDLKKDLMADPFLQHCEISDDSERRADKFFYNSQVLTTKLSESITSFGSPTHNRRTIGARCSTISYSTKSPKPDVRFTEASKFSFNKLELNPQAYYSPNEFNITGFSSRRKMSIELPESKENEGFYTGRQRAGSQEIRTSRICSLDLSREDDTPIEYNSNSNDQENRESKFPLSELQSTDETDYQKVPPGVSLTCKAAFSTAQNSTFSQTGFKIDLDNIVENNKTRKESLIPESSFADLLEERSIDYNIAEPMKPDHELLCVLKPFENRKRSTSIAQEKLAYSDYLCHFPDNPGFSFNSSLVLQGLDSHPNISSTEKPFMEVKGSIQVYQDQVREARPGCSNRLCAKIEPEKPSEISQCASEYVLGDTRARKSTYTQAIKTTTGSQPAKDNDEFFNANNVHNLFIY